MCIVCNKQLSIHNLHMMIAMCMFMSKCMCLCSECVDACACACVAMCMCMSMCMCSECVGACACAYVHMHMCKCICICAHVHMCICACDCIPYVCILIGKWDSNSIEPNIARSLIWPAAMAWKRNKQIERWLTNHLPNLQSTCHMEATFLMVSWDPFPLT